MSAVSQYVRIVTTVVCVGAAAAACGGGNQRDERTRSQVITADGSSTVFLITEAVAEEFQKAHEGTRVTVGRSGTGGGFQKFCRGEIDLANASRPIKPTEVDNCRAAGVDYIELPVAFDGLAVVVHPSNTWAQSITTAELKKLWEPAAQGKITRWSQVRAGWPDQEIHLFGPGVDSGTFDYFTEVVAGKSGASRGDYTSSEDDNVIVQGVSGDPNALGFFGYAYYEENKDKLKLVPVDSGSGPVAPSPETVENGTYAPLSRRIYVYPKVESLARPEFRSFVEFYLDHAATLSREVGYIPLPAAEYEAAEQKLSQAR